MSRQLAPVLGFDLAAGDAGVSETLAAMSAFVEHGRSMPRARALAAWMRRQGREPSLVLYDWLRRHVVFRRDPHGTELVRTPELLLERVERDGQASCDCDCTATLGATLLAAMGVEPAFCLTGHLAIMGHVPLRHVFYGAVAANGLDVIPYDPQEGVPPGRWPQARRTEVYRIFSRR